MAAVLTDMQPDDLQLEELWRRLHASWVAASEDLAKAEARALDAGDEMSLELLRFARAQEAHQRELLQRFERRMLSFRSRAAAYRARY